jgi:hypothetical protein
MTDPAIAVAVAPLVDALSPLVNAAISGLVVGIGALVFAGVAKLTGVAFTPDYQAQLEKAADGVVQAAVAKAENNLATGKFDVGNPIVAAIAKDLDAAIPVIVDKLGLTPALTRSEVVKAIGRAQVAMTAVAPVGTR